MGTLKYTVIFMAIVAYVVAEENDTLACCPQSSYILATFEHVEVCWNQTANTTAPVRFECDEIARSTNFQVVNGEVQLNSDQLLKLRFNREIIFTLFLIFFSIISKVVQSIAKMETSPLSIYLVRLFISACTGTMIRKLKNGTLTEPTPAALLCNRVDAETDGQEKYIASETLGYCMVVSVVFLGLTAIIYSCFRELRDLFGKSIINFCTALAIGMGIMSIMTLMPWYSDMDMCAVRGFLCYFFIVAAFFWTNSISIQVLRDTRRPCTVDYGWHEFRWFVLYSWGVPVLLTVIMAIVNFHPGEHDRPGIGLNHCWFIIVQSIAKMETSPLSIYLVRLFISACTGTMIRKLKNGTLTEPTPAALLCNRVDAETDGQEKYIASETLGYCMVVSVVFLGLTAIIYSCFRELRDLFGKSIINFCTALAIGMGIMSIMTLMPWYSDMDMCAVRGFLCYFFIVAAFFWTNSISIQVLRDTRRPCTVDYGWHEFRWFVLYSWGVPVLLTVIMAIVNFHPGEHDRPGIGLNHCWFITKEQQWYYMYSVISILLLVNIGIFIYISTMVWRHSFSSSHLKAVKFKLSMTVRLIVVMGLTWIFEMIGSLTEAKMAWAVMDVLNSIHGILLFLILVVFRKRVIKVMYKRGWLFCCSGLVERYLAVGDDAEENVVQHTDIPMNDDRTVA